MLSICFFPPQYVWSCFSGSVRVFVRNCFPFSQFACILSIRRNHMYTGIVGEWNPFHNGHKKLIDAVHAMDENGRIISVMSGAFVQRGEPALFDKWVRSAWAVRCGADAVVELPLLYALRSADLFAEGAVRLIAALGCTHIAFGAESVSAEELEEVSGWVCTGGYTDIFRSYLAEGLSYADAFTQAVASRYPDTAPRLTRPNDMLGFQYACAVIRHQLPLQLIVIRRNADDSVSSSRTRKELLSSGTASSLPAGIREEAEHLISCGCHTDYVRYEDACFLSSRMASLQTLRKSGLFSEGLENRWIRAMQSETWQDAVSQVKSRRYLCSRLKRIGAGLLLSFDGKTISALTPRPPSYARLLALKKGSSRMLRNSRIPIIVSAAKAEKALDPFSRAILSLDIHGADMQACCFRNPQYRRGGTDYYHSPQVVE